ncbi:MAG: hypothetical protein O7D91_08755 [Planctomycetota bacterium]|nr:hypothetical protein [Planctomycetota bacterium]
MADAQSKLSPKLIAGAVLILVLAGFAFSRYLGSDENTTPPSPAYEAMMADTAPEGYRVPPTRSGTGTPGAGASRLSGAEDTAEEEAQEEQGIDRKKRKNQKKKPRKESKKDDHGVSRFEDGKIDRKKMPPMGG